MPDQVKTDNAGRPIVDPNKDDGAPQNPPPVTGSAAAGAAGRSQMSPFREKAATWTAIAVIVALGFFYVYMLGHVDDDATHWARRMIILSGIEAIVFGAAGFLFGTSIQRQVTSAQVKNLEQTSEEKRQEAARAQMRADLEAERAKAATAAEQEARVKVRGGEMLAEAVLAKSAARPRPAASFRSGGLESLGEGVEEAVAGSEAASDLEELQRLAKKALG